MNPRRSARELGLVVRHGMSAPWTTRVPASRHYSVERLHQRADAFRRLARVLDHLHWPREECRAAIAALASAHELRRDGTRCIASRATLHVETRLSGLAAGVNVRVRGATEADARAVRAVIRAYVLRTSLAKRTIARALGLGGWYAEIALLVLPRVR